ncbi:MAG: hypothetical protein KGL39_07255 [Patescibacteria group bacterium]|nr:hypothetical protein [Patescibacteria group bacterium]
MINPLQIKAMRAIHTRFNTYWRGSVYTYPHHVTLVETAKLYRSVAAARDAARTLRWQIEDQEARRES